MSKHHDNKLYYLVDHLVKTIELPDFIEKETDIILKWRRVQQSAACHCPMPNHNDRNASFHLNIREGVWIYHCFGCGSKGHIIHFCMDYFGLRNKYEAILFICKKFNIKNKEDLILQGLKNVSKKVDIQRKIENLNIMVSNQCRMLLRSNLDLHKTWVFDTYKKLDEAMENDNCELVEAIGYEASNKMNGALEIS